MDGNGGEEGWLLQRFEHAGEADEVRHVNDAFDAIVEQDQEPMRRERADASNVSHHRVVLLHVRKRLFPSENGDDLYRPRRHAIDNSEPADDHLAER